MIVWLTPIGLDAPIHFNCFNFDIVIIQLDRIPLSLRTRGEIDLEEAKRQHEAYVRFVFIHSFSSSFVSKANVLHQINSSLLREIGLDVIELPPDESLPECAFVEDTAVLCNGIALITKPGSPHRAKEVSHT